jgi:hypothetical protein
MDRWLEWNIEYARDLRQISISLIEKTNDPNISKWPITKTVRKEYIDIHWFTDWSRLPDRVVQKQNKMLASYRDNQQRELLLEFLCKEAAKNKILVQCKKTTDLIDYYTKKNPTPKT